MLFSSLEFLFLFLPLCIAAYFLVPSGARNIVLLIFSLIFYGFGEPVYLFLMIFTISIDYAFGLLIQKHSSRKALCRTILILAVVSNLLLLGFFKYYDFLASSVSRITNTSFIRPIGLSLPIGISFYTFQSLSYVIDIYRGEVKAERSPIIPATYVTLFPQLIAGPIIKYNDIAGQIKSRRSTLSGIASGIRTFVCGLSKKVLLANTAGEIWQSFATSFNPSTADTVGVWLGIVCYAFQIYFDFSGYSDMAIGLGRIFGFEFSKNFNYPYISKSITDFWRRWHITLSSWFRDYVYIPLGGNRCSRARMYINLLVVWSLTGIWHGAGINFLLWGLYYFLILSIEKAFLAKLLEKLPSPIRHIYSIILILFGWLIFASDGSDASITISEALSCVKIMFGLSGTGFISDLTLYELIRNAVFLVIMLAASLPVFRKAYQNLLSSAKYGTATAAIFNILTPITFVVCVAYLVNSGYNPFLYFRF